MFDLTPFAFYTLPDGRRLRYAIHEPSGHVRHTIVIAPGRREFIEKKQYELSADLNQRGCRQIYFEWHGQGLSDRSLSGNQCQRDHATNFTLHVDDFRAFYRDIVTPNTEGDPIITGHSMGAHLLLRWLAEDHPALVRGAFFTAPMMTIGAWWLIATSYGLARYNVAHGHGEDYANVAHARKTQFDYMDDPIARMFDNNLLSQDRERFQIMEKYFTAHPELMVGGVTWGWLKEATSSIYLARKAGYLKAITIPVLTVTGNADKVTPIDSMMKCLNTIPHSKNLVIEGARHDVLNELSAYRTAAWEHIDSFLAQLA